METLESIAGLFGFGEKQSALPSRFASVVSVSGDTVSVTIGSANVDAVRCCDCTAGDVVLVETMPAGTLAAVAVKGYAGGGGYVLPPATTTTLGGVIADGTSVSVDVDGTIHAAEFGTSGNWAWIKLPGGIAACWGRHEWNITSWSTWGSVYTGTRFDPVAYPTGLFIAKPIEIVTMEGPNGATLWPLFGGTDNTSSSTRNYTPVRGTTGWTFTEPSGIDILAIGRWQ